MKKQSKISSLEVNNFTVFEHQKLEFCNGVNVVIGENGVGKSHLLKILYSSAYVSWKVGIENDTEIADNDSDQSHYTSKLTKVMRASVGGWVNLMRNKANNAWLKVMFTGNGEEELGITLRARLAVRSNSPAVAEEPVFIPSADVLSQYKGLIYSYERKYESRDETIRDLCSALSGVALIDLDQAMLGLVDNIEKIIGGTIELKDDEFYVKSGNKWLEIALAAEGHRKLVTIAHLIKNGTLRKDSILFWDEPETNLNPKLIVKTVEIIRELAAAGVQIFIATHDYLLTNEFGLAVEYETEPKVPVRFFALYKEKKSGPTVHESSDKLSGLRHDVILDEFAAHYDREGALFAKSMRGDK